MGLQRRISLGRKGLVLYRRQQQRQHNEGGMKAGWRREEEEEAVDQHVTTRGGRPGVLGNSGFGVLVNIELKRGM